MLTIDQVIRGTILFFTFKEKTTEFPKPNGCGLLIKINQAHYCISNAHVLGDRMLGKTFILIGNKKTLTIGGQHIISKAKNSENINEDKIDAAIVNLDAETVEILEGLGHNFIDYSDLIMGNKQNKNQNYLLAGLPATKVKISTHERKVKPRPMYVRTKSVDYNLNKIGVSSDYNILVIYRRNDFWTWGKKSKIKQAPLPHGMSGAGLWLTIKDENFNDKYFLAGVMSEYDENRGIIITTKIDIFVDLIRQCFDSTINIKSHIGVDILK